MTQTKLRDDQMSFNVSTGHDHDGSNSKQIAYSNITGAPSFETSASNIKADGAASVGSLSTVPRADHVHPDGDSGWITPTLQNSWVAQHEDRIPKYRKIRKTVYLMGLLKNGSSTTAVMFTFPEGYRPTQRLAIPGLSSTGLAQMRVDSNGEVSCASGGSTTWTSIDGISFPID